MKAHQNSKPTVVYPKDESLLAGSVKFYQQHLAVCTGAPPELWMARVEEMEGLFASLKGALKARGLNKIKLTACDAPSLGAEGFDIFLMPDMLRLPAITVDKVDKLADALVNQFTRGLPFDVQPMAGGDHVFVCTHANRDARCGEWGVPFHEAVRREIESQQAIAHLYQVSHIGGHRFAATCIIYPQGIWYGNLRPEDAPRLVGQHLNEERLLPEFYRGRLGTSFCQQVAEAEAAQALLNSYPIYESLDVQLVEQTDEASATAQAVVRGRQGYMRLQAQFTLVRSGKDWMLESIPVFE